MKDTYFLYDGKAIAYTMGKDERVVLLTHVWVHPSKRLEGVGSALLRMVLADADAEGKILMLTIDPDETECALDYSKLEAWYVRNGFEWMHDDSTMVRFPKEKHD